MANDLHGWVGDEISVTADIDTLACVSGGGTIANSILDAERRRAAATKPTSASASTSTSSSATPTLLPIDIGPRVRATLVAGPEFHGQIVPVTAASQVIDQPGAGHWRWEVKADIPDTYDLYLSIEVLSPQGATDASIQNIPVRVQLTVGPTGDYTVKTAVSDMGSFLTSVATPVAAILAAFLAASSLWRRLRYGKADAVPPRTEKRMQKPPPDQQEWHNDGYY